MTARPCCMLGAAQSFARALTAQLYCCQEMDPKAQQLSLQRQPAAPAGGGAMPSISDGGGQTAGTSGVPPADVAGLATLKGVQSGTKVGPGHSRKPTPQHRFPTVR